MPSWLCEAVAAVPTNVGPGALPLEGKLGSIQELEAQTDFILFPYTLGSNDSFKCSNPSSWQELCWMVENNNKSISHFQPLKTVPSRRSSAPSLLFSKGLSKPWLPSARYVHHVPYIQCLHRCLMPRCNVLYLGLPMYISYGATVSVLH